MGLGYFKDGAWQPVRNRADATTYATLGSVFGVPGCQIVHYNSVITLAGAKLIVYFPFVVTRPITITDAAMQVTLAGAGDVALYIVKADDNLQPVGSTAHTVAAAVDISTTGLKNVTSLSIDLDPGLYLSEIYETDNGNAQLRTFNAVIPALTEFPSVEDTLPSIRPNVHFSVVPSPDVPHAPWTSMNRYQNAGIGLFSQCVLYKWMYQ